MHYNRLGADGLPRCLWRHARVNSEGRYNQAIRSDLAAKCLNAWNVNTKLAAYSDLWCGWNGYAYKGKLSWIFSLRFHKIWVFCVSFLYWFV